MAKRDELAPDSADKRRSLTDADLLDSAYASPPCLLGELDPVWLGGLTEADVLALLHELKELQQEGMRIVCALDPEDATAGRIGLSGLQRSVTARCETLTRQIGRFRSGQGAGSDPSARSIAIPALAVKPAMARFRQIQETSARIIRDALPRLFDDRLATQLREMAHACDEELERWRDDPVLSGKR